MRTNIDINDELLAKAMQAGPYRTKKEAVEAGLKLLARRAAYQSIRALRGKILWDDSEAALPAWETGTGMRPARQSRKSSNKPRTAKQRAIPTKAGKKRVRA